MTVFFQQLYAIVNSLILFGNPDGFEKDICKNPLFVEIPWIDFPYRFKHNEHITTGNHQK